MLESENCSPSHELHLRAARERSLAINALVRSAACKYAQWLGTLAHNGVGLARNLAEEWRLRRDIRMLQRFEDRELADMGLGRSEIEHVVRRGRVAAPRDRISPAPPYSRAKAGRPSV